MLATQPIQTTDLADFFKVSGCAIYNHLPYFLSCAWDGLRYFIMALPGPSIINKNIYNYTMSVFTTASVKYKILGKVLPTDNDMSNHVEYKFCF